MQLTQKQIDYCMECGVCTGSCPVSRELPLFSPRQMIKRALLESEADLLQGHEVWSCLSCARCSVRCPAEIDFPEFNRSYRQAALKAGNTPQQSHHGILQTISAIQTLDIHQSRTQWAAEAGLFRETGDYYYFVGCLPHFDVVFRYLNVSPLETAKSVLTLLNRLGLEPVISNNERCCGHDAFWSGDEDTFRKLAQLNLDVIRSSGAKTVLFSCPEGYYTFKKHYPEYVGDLPFEVLHMTEFLVHELSAAKLPFEPPTGGPVTFHDPCRLGRFMGNYDSPRQLLQLLPETELIEMERNRENALCCGTTAWMECSSCSKAMQIERLEEALQTGAETLVTACPKCQIHLSCAQRDAKLDLKVVDLYAYLSKRLIGDDTQR